MTASGTMSLNSGFGMRLIFLWLACTAAITLVPFDFVVPPSNHERVFTGFSGVSRQEDPIHFTLNALLFAPLGALVHYRGQRRAANLLVIAIIGGSAAFLLSFCIEWLQHLLPARESSFVDITANTIGAVAGVFASRAFHRAIVGRVRQFRQGWW